MNYWQFLKELFPAIKENEIEKLEDKPFKLLKEANSIMNHFTQEDKAFFNVFSAMKVEKKEVTTHSAILFYLLKQSVGFNFENTYFNLFLKALGVPETSMNQKWQVYREKYFNHGRIDFVFESPNMVIAIEMKVDADDQPQQLVRYENYCRSRHKDYRIYYLTLDGKEPSEQSCEGIDRKRLYLISFEKTIMLWLNACINITEENGYKYSFLHQYLAVVQHLTKEEEVNDKLKDILKTRDDVLSAFALFVAAIEKMGDCMMKFYKCLQCELQHRGLPSAELDEEAITQYYLGKANTYPRLICDLDEHIFKDGRRMTFSLVVETELKLYFCLSFLEYDKDGNWSHIPWKSARKKCAWLFDKWQENVEKLCIENCHSHTNSILWAYLLNSKGEEIDFRNYNDAALSLIENCDDEAAFISDYLLEVLRDLCVID